MNRIALIRSLAQPFDSSSKRKVSGIYCWLNTTNGKVYVGRSKDVRRRRDGHRYKLRNGHCYYTNPHFQCAWNKLGESGFEFLLLEDVEERHRDSLSDRELYWIGHFSASDRNFGYNLKDKYKEGCFGHAKESIEKMRKKATGRRHTETTKQKLSKTNSDGRCLSFKGPMPQDIRDNISRARTGMKLGPCRKETREKIRQVLTGRKLSKEHIETLKRTHTKPDYILNKPVIQYALSGEVVKEFFSASQASREVEGTRPNGISRCCRGLQKTCGGFVWDYVKEAEQK